MKFPNICSEKRDSNPPSSAYVVGEVVYSTVTFSLTKRIPLVYLKMAYLFESLSLLYSPRSVYTAALDMVAMNLTVTNTN